MKELETGLEKLILVCLHERSDGRASCLPRGAAEVHARLKGWVTEHGLSGRVRVSKSGCLDRCAEGATILVLPEFRWYGEVTLADVDRILAEHLAALAPAPDSDLKERP